MTGPHADRRPSGRRVVGVTACAALAAAVILTATTDDPGDVGTADGPDAAASAAAAPPAWPSAGAGSSHHPAGATSPSAPRRTAAIEPIPATGVPPIPAPPPTELVTRPVHVMERPVQPPTEADLMSPTAAAAAWFTRWCPFDHTTTTSDRARLIRPGMTDAGWASDAPGSDTARQESWRRSVAAGESGRCSDPSLDQLATVGAGAGASGAGAVIVQLTAPRVITRAEHTPYVELVEQTRVVVRGGDGLWRVDVPVEGG